MSNGLTEEAEGSSRTGQSPAQTRRRSQKLDLVKRSTGPPALADYRCSARAHPTVDRAQPVAARIEAGTTPRTEEAQARGCGLGRPMSPDPVSQDDVCTLGNRTHGASPNGGTAARRRADPVDVAGDAGLDRDEALPEHVLTRASALVAGVGFEPTTFGLWAP